MEAQTTHRFGEPVIPHTLHVSKATAGAALAVLSLVESYLSRWSWHWFSFCLSPFLTLIFVQVSLVIHSLLLFFSLSSIEHLFQVLLCLPIFHWFFSQSLKGFILILDFTAINFPCLPVFEVLSIELVVWSACWIDEGLHLYIEHCHHELVVWSNICISSSLDILETLHFQATIKWSIWFSAWPSGEVQVVLCIFLCRNRWQVIESPEVCKELPIFIAGADPMSSHDELPVDVVISHFSI